MRAMVLRGNDLAIEEVPTPQPGSGQVLARVLAAGICGSDLHAAAAPGRDPSTPIVMGHEFVAEVVASGPGTTARPGARVTGMPLLLSSDAPGGVVTIGYSPIAPGGFGEYLLLSEQLLIEAPAELRPEVVAMTEPLAVGLHAVRRGRVQPGESVLIMGAGPVGLMTLLWLRAEGIEDVAVSDPSPERRALARRVGASLVLDPRTDDIRSALAEAFAGQFRGRDEPGAAFGAGPGGPAPDVVFECVGVAGTIQEAMSYAQVRGRVVVVGVCMGEDRLQPAAGIMKELSLEFVLGYTGQEYQESLDALAAGTVDTTPLISRVVTLDELPEAFRSLSDPRECKVIVRHAS